MEKPLVLIVEDHDWIQRVYAISLRDHAELLQALDTDTAREIIEEYSDRIVAVIMDGHVPNRAGKTLGNRQADTVPLVKLLRDKGSQAIIVAFSSDPAMRRQLVAAGCDKDVDKDLFQKNREYDRLPWVLGLVAG